jgi:hypothetical protein
MLGLMGFYYQDGKHNGTQGIDLIIWRGNRDFALATEWYVLDVKATMAAILLKETSMGSQMTDSWIRINADKLAEHSDPKTKAFGLRLVAKLRGLHPIPTAIVAMDSRADKNGVNSGVFSFLKIALP